jgi:hypothetical protein
MKWNSRELGTRSGIVPVQRGEVSNPFNGFMIAASILGDPRMESSVVEK